MEKTNFFYFLCQIVKSFLIVKEKVKKKGKREKGKKKD